MIKHIGIFLGADFYDVKKHFSYKLGEALNRLGIQTTFYDFLEKGAADLSKKMAEKNRPDLFCSFYTALKWNPAPWVQFQRQYGIPFLNILLDSPTTRTIQGLDKETFIATVDHFDCAYLKKMGFEKAFFLGHGVERELTPVSETEKIYDVVFLGTSYDPEELEETFNKFNERQRKAIQEGIEAYFSDPRETFQSVADQMVKQEGVDENERDSLLYYISSYVKAMDRVELIKSIKNNKIHVFGGACFRPPKQSQGWNHYFLNAPNVVVHPAIPMKEAVEVIKKSKICLNSMPFFKNGTHERLLIGAAAGALVVNTDTIWVRDHFVEGEDLLLYQPKKWGEIGDQLDEYLKDDQKRGEMAERARSKVLAEHTWDHRAAEILKVVK